MDAELYLRLLAQIQKGRRELEEVEGEYDARMTKARTENQYIADVLVQRRESLQVSETALRTLVLDEFKATGQKKFPLGTEVKVYEDVVYDEAKALEWCSTNFQAAIQKTLNKPVFKAYAKAQIIPGLVEIVKTPKAMLPVKIVLEEPKQELPHLQTIDTPLKAPPALDNQGGA
jgi:hypothetical protein